ncbi:Uncharacterised protein [Moraxella lacunata]|uniref:Uncharacterized protein n=1 Tax=Moraxella lacunata TaxID=477 RepID=A0A378QMC0_MORLA|nr:hypothetical protein [Moraxella lacunata]STZ00483.1 Uncharacterised protein [Moraxella lacunata]
MNSFDHFGQTASHLYGLYETWAKSKGINYATLAVLHTPPQGSGQYGKSAIRIRQR